MSHPGWKPKLTEAQREEVIEYYKQGIRLEWICKKYGVSKGLISKMASHRGISKRTKHDKPRVTLPTC